LRAEWARTDDPTKRKQLVDEIQRLAYDEVPYVPLRQWTQRRTFRSHVKGALPFAAPLLWNVWLDKQ
jgi:peptide/nickel transport system substrate-binding protein